MEQKEFDTRLMTLAYKIRKCREATKQVTRSYPDHARRLAEATEKQMLDADIIIGGLIGILHESEMALCEAIKAAIAKAQGVQNKLLAKYQPCGCVVCTCEDEYQCQGCGAKHCGTHPVGEVPVAKAQGDV
jgi:hypothetical protein